MIDRSSFTKMNQYLVKMMKLGGYLARFYLILCLNLDLVIWPKRPGAVLTTEIKMILFQTFLLVVWSLSDLFRVFSCNA